MDKTSNFTGEIISLHQEDLYSMAELIDLAIESRLAFNELNKSIREQFIKSHPQWLNTYQAAYILNVSGSTMKRYRSLGLLRYKVVKGLCKYRYDDIMELLQNMDTLAKNY